MRIRLGQQWWNWTFFIVGIFGVWLTTHSLLVVFLAWVASIHMDVKVVPKSIP